MQTQTIAIASTCMIALTMGCTTGRLDRHELRLSVGDMQAIRELISTDPVLPSDWVLNHATYNMMSFGMEPAQVDTNSLSISLVDSNSPRGTVVTFQKEPHGKWKREDVLRTYRNTIFVGDIPYDMGERIIETVLSVAVARSNGLDVVQRIYAIPDDSPHRGPEVSSWMSNWERWPADAGYLVNLYRSRDFAKSPEDRDANEVDAEVFVRSENGQAHVIRVDVLSPAIKGTRFNGKYVAGLVFDLWIRKDSLTTEGDNRLITLAIGGCTSDKFADRLIQDSPILGRRNVLDGWGRPFRLQLDPAHGTFTILSSGPNGKFGDADDMQRTWNLTALRDRQLKEVAKQESGNARKK